MEKTKDLDGNFTQLPLFEGLSTNVLPLSGKSARATHRAASTCWAQLPLLIVLTWKEERRMRSRRGFNPYRE